MRVLLPIYKDQAFTREQATSLSEFCNLKTSYDDFWNNRGEYDIVQLNWPEELTQWREPTDLELVFAKQVLQKWAQKSRIVVTRHNFHPHYSDTKKYRALYDIVYSAAHCVIHMGHFSDNDYRVRYADEEFLNSQIQQVIPHPVFSSYPRNMTREEARHSLGISHQKFFMLAFGRVQSAAEKNIVTNAYLGLPTRNKMAVVPGWKKARGKEPINRLIWSRLKSSGRFHNDHVFVPDCEVSIYFQAADIVVIPRVNVLNSGLVPLCVNFDAPAAIPDCGNLTEQARAMECTVYDPNCQKSIKEAMHRAFHRRGYSSSYKKLKKQLAPKLIAKQFFELYSNLG